MRLLSSLCLLEPLVAVAWAQAFSFSRGIALSWPQTFIIFTAFWLVYAADHWLDAARANGAKLLTARHAFAAEHRRAIAVVWVLALVSSISVSIMSLSLAEWRGGLTIAALAVLYLALVHRTRSTRLQLRKKGAKEIGVAVVFAAGTTLFLWTNDRPSSQQVILNVLFGLLVLQNLVTIAHVEQHIDSRHNAPSVACRLPNLGRPLHLYCGVLMSACLLFAVVAWVYETSACFGPLCFGLAVSSVCLLAVQRMPSRDVEGKHMLADVAVLIGALPTFAHAAC